MNLENLERAANLFEKQKRLNEWENMLKAQPTVLKFSNNDSMVLQQHEEEFLRSQIYRYIDTEREYINQLVKEL